jgi:hypothetical protein
VKFGLEANVMFRAASEKNHSTRIATAEEMPRERCGSNKVAHAQSAPRHLEKAARLVAEKTGTRARLSASDFARQREFTNLYRSARNGEFTLQDFHENAMR